LKLLDTYSSYAQRLGADPDFEPKAQYVIGELVLHGQMPNKDERDQYYQDPNKQ
jgi:hypothetical protein